MNAKPTLPAEEAAARRTSARRTVLIVGGIALAFYVGFIALMAVSK